MTEKQRLERLEKVLGLLIAWSMPSLGSRACDRLLAMLVFGEEYPPTPHEGERA